MAKKAARKAAAKSKGVNKTKFIRELVTANNDISWNDVLAKWHADGHTEDLNQVLYYHVRRALGLVKEGAPKKKSRKSSKRKAKVAQQPKAAPTRMTSTNLLMEVERHLDEIIIALGSSHGDVVDALRNARRHVSSRIVKSNG